MHYFFLANAVVWVFLAGYLGFLFIKLDKLNKRVEQMETFEHETD